jgi:hypothetical protein
VAHEHVAARHCCPDDRRRLAAERSQQDQPWHRVTDLIGNDEDGRTAEVGVHLHEKDEHEGDERNEYDAGNDLKAAADALKVAGAAVIADAEAAAAGGTTTTTVAAPTAVDTGTPVDTGPNVALLGMAALLVLLASGAFVLRLTADRR